MTKGFDKQRASVPTIRHINDIEIKSRQLNESRDNPESRGYPTNSRIERIKRRDYILR